MRVGSLVFATDQGLGILAKSFHDAGIVTDVLVIRHGRRPEHDEWYPRAQRIFNLKAQSDDLWDFARSMDAMLFFETPFDWTLIPKCRERAIKTFLMPMYECTPKVLPYVPDRFLCPSLLECQHFPDRSEFIPVPVEVPWTLRTRAKVFVHNAGHGGLKGRNGTAELMAAIPLVKCQARFIIRSQGPIQRTDDHRVIAQEAVPYEQLYSEGDVFVFPEKFNGLSLPLQEARAAGMLVMGTDRFPINGWLPSGPLIEPSNYVWSNISPRFLDFHEAVIEPQAIAAKIDEWYGRDISAYSLAGREWAQSMSWESLAPRYKEALCG